ncbi:bifunctional hydroxymethylpyrimidine kinase/phosphomethylpyrimidine kinase [Pseudoblastomonas halimionae]|uniref:hydroxymethylpyrimidine kinase n=1 Tax=Alteriqipengyuania halimionae TaxID=1926630 RepID=A0A6I4U581_9SPHN|nr:bifunctional hydroxymethylpyrimidine kinase/phosphomethylpyrimidine kinase [Alteriqipengyuania halimionae]MXP10514.1 bifunctional hydroxymethylpyrimidine kinase/phosphomethylpyrimidine kinase [Alteriqipengyuania halimionae]
MSDAPPRILIIAGSDSSGGAGIQADIKTVTMLNGYAMTAITALTAQNTQGVRAVEPASPGFVREQIAACVEDIGVDAVKIGMLGGAEIAGVVADALAEIDAPIVFDPVMVATSGSALADEATIAQFARLMEVATLVTPNLPELAALTEMPIGTSVEIAEAAELLLDRHGCAVLAKGGHGEGEQIKDILVTEERAASFQDHRIDTRHTHGTGCTLSSAIATLLGHGQPLEHSVQLARKFVRKAIAAAPGFGAGHGPLGQQAVRRLDD